ncbi:MAG: hypothetical protein EBR09_13645 [Proteobacteria bacterium]|nr:hypothetical protein [Pseudomonadota bacterium]
MNLKLRHDQLLIKDLKRHSELLIYLYAVSAVAALTVGVTAADSTALWLVGGGGFLAGISVEKFATRQIRRIAKQLAENQKIEL